MRHEVTAEDTGTGVTNSGIDIGTASLAFGILMIHVASPQLCLPSVHKIILSVKTEINKCILDPFYQTLQVDCTRSAFRVPVHRMFTGKQAMKRHN